MLAPPHLACCHVRGFLLGRLRSRDGHHQLRARGALVYHPKCLARAEAAACLQFVPALTTNILLRHPPLRSLFEVCWYLLEGM